MLQSMFMEVHVRGLKLQGDELEAGSQYVRRFAVSLRDLDVSYQLVLSRADHASKIQDHVMTSDINLFMCYDADYPREPESSMVLLEMEVRYNHTVIASSQ